MNDTAKKLREAADYAKEDNSVSIGVIRQAQDALGVEGTGTYVGNIGAVLNAIADEMDELQAKANEANNLRQQLESAEDKAERRKTHIVYLNTVIQDKNDLLKQRGCTIFRLTLENSHLRRQVPTERERQILAMWPRFEDGEPMMRGDEVNRCYGLPNNIAKDICFVTMGFDDRHLTRVGGDDLKFFKVNSNERVKRPAPKVLDADGVEIKVGDTVWYKSGIVCGIVESIDAGSLMHTVRYRSKDGTEYRDAARDLTHTPPDSWERLEADAVKGVCEYAGAEPCGRIDAHDCGTCRFYGQRGEFICEQLMALDIVRRAKALAKVEVAE